MEMNEKERKEKKNWMNSGIKLRKYMNGMKRGNLRRIALELENVVSELEGIIDDIFAIADGKDSGELSAKEIEEIKQSLADYKAANEKMFEVK
jgi:hypothetical protein